MPFLRGIISGGCPWLRLDPQRSRARRIRPSGKRCCPPSARAWARSTSPRCAATESRSCSSTTKPSTTTTKAGRLYRRVALEQHPLLSATCRCSVTRLSRPYGRDSKSRRPSDDFHSDLCELTDFPRLDFQEVHQHARAYPVVLGNDDMTAVTLFLRFTATLRQDRLIRAIRSTRHGNSRL